MSAISTTSTANVQAGRAAALPACAKLTVLFHDPLLEEPPTGGTAAADRRRYAELVGRAGAACRSCALLEECLYRAVVEHDVAGFAGGTTARQRAEIRRRLGVSVAVEDFSTLAGVVGSRQVDHAEVLRQRAAHPDESLETLAGRLGCSLSTVKRHLRQERRAPAASAPRRSRPRPQHVLALAAELTAGRRAVLRAA